MQKFLSQAGVASRRKAEVLINEGKVRVGSKSKNESDFVIAKLGNKIDPQNDIIEVDGKIINQTMQLVYYALNKPVGYTSSLSDIHAKKLATELVPHEPKVWPVGRLDKDSSGLMILTNDGELTNFLTHPKYKHEKEYFIKLKTQNSNFKTITENLKLLQKPIRLPEGVARFDKIKILKIDQEKNLANLSVVLHQGWKRQIRRMAEKAGFDVLELKRTRIAKLKLADLAEGKYRVIKKSDII